MRWPKDAWCGWRHRPWPTMRSMLTGSPTRARSPSGGRCRLCDAGCTKRWQARNASCVRRGVATRGLQEHLLQVGQEVESARRRLDAVALAFNQATFGGAPERGVDCRDRLPRALGKALQLEAVGQAQRVEHELERQRI